MVALAAAPLKITTWDRLQSQTRLAPLLILTVLVIANVSSPAAAQKKGNTTSEKKQPTLQRGPSIQCELNETREWRMSPSCGFNDVGMPIGAEYKCSNYYDTASMSCKRKCELTGRCNEP